MARELVYGRHAVAALLASDPAGVRELWLQENRHDALAERTRETARRHGIALSEVSRTTLDRLCAGAAHHGIAASYRATRARLAPRRAPADADALVEQLGEQALLLVLDGVQDPHNLGACLRTAEAAGADAVVVPRHRAVGLTAAARQAASGAAERVALVVVANLAEALARLARAGLLVVGASADAAHDYTGVDLGGRVAIVLGGEGKGLRRLTRERCDLLVRIPMAGAAQSLNVSVAAGVMLFEARRQRAAARGRGPG